MAHPGSHQRLIIQVVEEALARGAAEKENLNGIAATYGPGLAGAVAGRAEFWEGSRYASISRCRDKSHGRASVFEFPWRGEPSYPFLS